MNSSAKGSERDEKFMKASDTRDDSEVIIKDLQITPFNEIIDSLK